MSWPRVIDRLENGELVVLRPTGNSMTPRIKPKQAITLSPIGRTPIETGMIVLAKVKGRYYLHLVTAVDDDRVQISNNHGHVNGWTTFDRVYGVVTKIAT